MHKRWKKKKYADIDSAPSLKFRVNKKEEEDGAVSIYKIDCKTRHDTNSKGHKKSIVDQKTIFFSFFAMETIPSKKLIIFFMHTNFIRDGKQNAKEIFRFLFNKKKRKP